MRIHLFVLLLALGLAAPALADDWDGISDAIGSRTTADDTTAESDTEEADTAAETDDEDSEPGRQAVKSKAVDLDEKAAEQKPYRATDPNRPGANGDAEGKRNVLGPLWGVPSGSPVMQNIDPEMEKQYAVNGEGRLVPKPDAEELEEQQREAQRAERQRQREAERAAKERRWAEEKAQREAEKEANRQQRASTQQPRVEAAQDDSQEEESHVEDENPSPDDDTDERRTLKIGCRGEDE